jgi:hypothetical protein
MHWELWAVPEGNMIAAPTNEVEAAALVRELLGKGWPAGDLSLIAEDEQQAPELLPPALTGRDLAQWAEEPSRNRLA